ncbi:MAG: hypothetical protein Kow0037_32630 [Calditrichia bacterium]
MSAVFYLILSILSSVGVGIVIHLNESRQLQRLPIMVFNYIGATILGLLFLKIPGEIPASFSRLVPLSLATGAIFVGAFIVYMAAVQKMGLAIPVTVTRLSVVLPVVGSILLFGEVISFLQLGGLILALLAIFLFSYRREESSDRAAHPVLIPVLLFFLMGSGDFCLKIFQENFSPTMLPPYMILVFITSAIISGISTGAKKIPFGKAEVIAGFILGIPNFFSAYFILKVLQKFPGAIAFPLNNIGIILLSTLVGYLAWNEQLSRIKLIAVVLAVVAVILLSGF